MNTMTVAQTRSVHLWTHRSQVSVRNTFVIGDRAKTVNRNAAGQTGWRQRRHVTRRRTMARRRTHAGVCRLLAGSHQVGGG